MYLEAGHEIITLREALTRIHLEGLCPENDNTLVEWYGYPIPFHCGHDAVRGFGPLDRPEDNDRNGKGRRYQEKVRISQHFCSGAVLFCWGCISEKRTFRLNMSVCISIDTTPRGEGDDTVLKLCFTA